MGNPSIIFVVGAVCGQLLLGGCQLDRTRVTLGTDSIPRKIEKQGEQLVADGRYGEAIDLILPYAKHGDPEAEFTVAILLGLKDAQRVEDREILNWTRKAASKGHRRALQYLSDSYRWGWLNLPTNQVMSEMWSDAIRHTNRIPECLRFESTILTRGN